MESRIVIVLLVTIFCIGICKTAPIANAEIVSSIDDIQKKFSNNKNIEDESKEESLNVEESQNNLLESKISRQTKGFKFPSDDLSSESSARQDKMMGYFGYYPQQAMSSPFYSQSPQDFYMDYPNTEDEQILSRANRRRPQNALSSYENSPIFYIRLPPTPYMFVPGLGYISQPPSMTPMNPIAPTMAAPQSPIGYSPFINVPLNFVSNGKPTNIYQWAGTGGYGQQPPSFGQQPSSFGQQSASFGQQSGSFGQQPVSFGQQSVSFGQQPVNFASPTSSTGYGQQPSLFGQPAGNFGHQQSGFEHQSPGYGHQPNGYRHESTSFGQQSQFPQFPLGYPQRPQRPFKPKPFVQDSKIHNLKGQYLFNGRPEEIFLLQNSYNSLYPQSLQNYY